jgi:hypothetical protein
LGFLNENAKIEDQLKNMNIFENVKKREYFISEIVVYFHKYINYLEVEYTNKKNGSKIRYLHMGKESIF